MSLETMRVLLVDDDVSLCLMLTEFLARHRVAVECVHRGDEALAAFAAGSALTSLILDVMLPGIDGFTPP